MRIRRQARLSVNLLVMARYTAQGKTSDEILGDFEAGAMDADYGGSTTEYMQAAVTAARRSGAGTVGQGGGSRSVRQHGRGDRGGRGGDSPLGAETLGVQLANAFPHKAGVRSSSLPPRQYIVLVRTPAPKIGVVVVLGASGENARTATVRLGGRARRRMEDLYALVDEWATTVAQPTI